MLFNDIILIADFHPSEMRTVSLVSLYFFGYIQFSYMLIVNNKRNKSYLLTEESKKNYRGGGGGGGTE